jgi:ankyrin repeat protein
MFCEQEKTTALIQAAYKGQLEACKLLVERGANLNIQDKVKGEFLRDGCSLSIA